MRSGATPVGVDGIDTLLRRFAAGEVDRWQLMDHLDISYGEMLELLHQRGIPLPLAPAAERSAMAQTLNRLLDEAGD